MVFVEYCSRDAAVTDKSLKNPNNSICVCAGSSVCTVCDRHACSILKKKILLQLLTHSTSLW